MLVWKRFFSGQAVSLGKTAFSFLGFLICVFAGAAVLMKLEEDQDWSYGESVYFAFVSLTTIGYGDFAPASTGGRVFFFFWAIIGLGIVGYAIGALGDRMANSVEGQLKKNEGDDAADLPPATFSWKNYIKMFALVLIFVILLFIGGAIFPAIDNAKCNDASEIAAGTCRGLIAATEMTYFEGFYFSFVTLTTIGFGDFFPRIPLSRAFVSVYAVIGLALVGVLIAEIGDSVMHSARLLLAKDADKLKMKEALKDINALNKSAHLNNDKDIAKLRKALRKSVAIFLDEESAEEGSYSYSASASGSASGSGSSSGSGSGSGSGSSSGSSSGSGSGSGSSSS